MKKIWVLILIFGGIPSAHGAKTSAFAPSPRPGEVIATSGGNQIILEGGRSLTWGGDGVLKLQEPGAAASVQVDLKSKPKKSSGQEEMGLEVDEADLGGRTTGKGYLHGKKDPRGRALDPSQVGRAPEESGQGTSQSQEVAGVKITQTKYPNGSYRYEFNWGKTKETIFFDKRSTLVWDEIRGNTGSMNYKMRQWADGSFSRIYQGKDGEFNYNFDALSGGYRLIFSNAAGEIVAEASCDGSCSLD